MFYVFLIYLLSVSHPYGMPPYVFLISVIIFAISYWTTFNIILEMFGSAEIMHRRGVDCCFVNIEMTLGVWSMVHCHVLLSFLSTLCMVPDYVLVSFHSTLCMVPDYVLVCFLSTLCMVPDYVLVCFLSTLSMVPDYVLVCFLSTLCMVPDIFP